MQAGPGSRRWSFIFDGHAHGPVLRGMSELPEGGRGRLLAVGLLVTVLASAWAGIVAPLTDWYAARAEQVDRQATIARRMAQIGAELPALRARAAGADAAVPVPVLEGATDSVAGAALQQRLQQIGTETGASFASTEVLPGEQVGAYRRIGIRLSVSAPWPVVVHLLDAITTGTPRLLVNDLQVQSARSVMNDVDPILNTSLLVFGFRAGTAS